jgi:shikimate kinase
MKLYLIGFMGSGKSAYGQQLAQLLNWDFVDLDERVTEQADMSIPALFEQEGEDSFRQWEQQALYSTASLTYTVIATGGGTPCFYENLSWMQEQGTTVYLKLLPDKLIKRLKKEQQKRPLIKDMRQKALQQFVHQQLAERAPYYLKADIVIDPVDLPPKVLKDHLSQVVFRA